MANFPQKRNINVAAANKRSHDLSHAHIGTVDFGRMKPIECRYMVPGDDFNINVTNQTRVLNAMPSPTIGSFDCVYRSFFVPIKNVWKPFYDFLKGQNFIGNDGDLHQVSHPPYIKLSTLREYVCKYENIDYEPFVEFVGNHEPAERSQYDFAVQYQSQGIPAYYKWTKRGRLMNDFFTSLGINIPWGGYDDVDYDLYIILPLMCFWKFYFDWIVPARFIRNHEDFIERFINLFNDDYQTDFEVTDAQMFFEFLCHEPLSYYLDDIFTSSTVNAFSDDDSSGSSTLIHNPSSRFVGNGTSMSVVGHNPQLPDDIESDGAVVYGASGAYERFNMFTLQTLGKLQDMLNRNLLVGSKVQDWLLSEFGIRPNNDALNLSTYLGSKRYQLDIRDVISNADTEAQGGTPLGSYAGYVKSESRFDFGYKAQEHGFFFITFELVPRTSYYQGLQSQFDLKDRFDFFQPEFDNQQGAPIPFRRLFFAHDHIDQLTRFDNKFGFTLQYADLKFAPDVISGDFRNRFGLSLRSWFLARDMSYIADENNSINGIDEEFCLVRSKYQDWNYIFSDMNGELDPFLVFFYFNMSHCMRPMKSITEGFEPTYKNGNHDIKLDFSGSVK